MFRILWDLSSGSIKSASLKLLVMFCVRTQNITRNFSEALLILPEDGSQRIRNMSEFFNCLLKY